MSVYIEPREKLFGHMDRLHELRTGGMTSAPINVEIDLSNRCSLGCSWCHFAYTHTRGPLAGKRDKPAGSVAGGDLMDIDLAYRIVGQLVRAGVRSVTWTGGGEPTLHPGFDRLVWFATEQRLPQGVYTHGGHIDADRADLLKKKMTFVYVSLDASDAEAYERDKGVDRFDAACDGIRHLVAADGDATVGVGFLITERNWRDAWHMGALARDLGADYAQFRPVVLYNQDAPTTPAENTAWMGQAVRELNRVALENPVVDFNIDRFRMYQNWQGHGYDTCLWSTLQTCITPNGKVWACVNKREHAAAEIGDLSVESFAHVWGRHRAVEVTSDCRVMCRGHQSNLALNDVMVSHSHPEFV